MKSSDHNPSDTSAKQKNEPGRHFSRVAVVHGGVLFGAMLTNALDKETPLPSLLLGSAATGLACDGIMNNLEGISHRRRLAALMNKETPER